VLGKLHSVAFEIATEEEAGAVRTVARFEFYPAAGADNAAVHLVKIVDFHRDVKALVRNIILQNVDL
jgi:hypothetical protein